MPPQRLYTLSAPAPKSTPTISSFREILAVSIILFILSLMEMGYLALERFILHHPVLSWLSSCLPVMPCAGW